MRTLPIVLALSLVVVAGCSQQTVSSPASNATLAVPRARSASFSTVYSFKGAPDGSIPEAGLTLFAGKFYGTTTKGGTGPHNDGTVFTVQEDGTERVIHSFTFTPDGADPEAGLTNLNNGSLSLYGTTSVGGDYSFGTFYEIKTDGTERVLYSFKCNLKMCNDGANPEGDLTVRNGLLYGTTLNGGACCGIVFEVNTDGTERIVHEFAGPPDGESPYGGLVQLNGSFYGTTEFGGANDAGCVFKVDTNGTERVLYSFKGATSTDGALPLAGLTVLNGLLYGVTSKGGASNDGTVFEVHEDGTERVIHSFNGSDGMFPYAGLTLLNGVLYGTTIRGGADDSGTVFEIHPDGMHRVLHSFNGEDGFGPDGSLAVTKGNALIGTTRRGGASNNGTVFLVMP